MCVYIYIFFFLTVLKSALQFSRLNKNRPKKMKSLWVFDISLKHVYDQQPFTLYLSKTDHIQSCLP